MANGEVPGHSDTANLAKIDLFWRHVSSTLLANIGDLGDRIYFRKKGKNRSTPFIHSRVGSLQHFGGSQRRRRGLSELNIMKGICKWIVQNGLSVDLEYNSDKIGQNRVV